MKKKSRKIYGVKTSDFKSLSRLWLALVDEELKERAPELQQQAAREAKMRESRGRRDAWNHRER